MPGGEREGPLQQALAGPRLAGDDVESGTEFEPEILDQREIRDPQFMQHARPSARPRQVRAQPSFVRSRS